jgi:hypothetical protein
MVDCVFHGLRTLLDKIAIDYYHISHMYNTYQNPIELYGNGFTIFAKLDDIIIDRTDLDKKISDKFFDQIIIPIHNNRHNCKDNVDTIKQFLSYNNVVKVIDGNDDGNIDMSIAELCPYFKRELFQPTKNVLPISFSVPSTYIVDTINIESKTNSLSNIKPCFGGRAAWTYIDEQQYRTEYQNSLFAITTKKGGWDCLRHYEIIANGCLPLFTDIDACPEFILTTLPKKILQHLNTLYTTEFTQSQVTDVATELLEISKQKLTTTYIAQKILEA